MSRSRRTPSASGNLADTDSGAWCGRFLVYSLHFLWREIKRYQFCLLTCCFCLFFYDSSFAVTSQQRLSAAAVSVVLRCPWSPVRPSTWGVLLSPFSASVCLHSAWSPSAWWSHIFRSPPSSHQHNCVKYSWALPQGVHLRIPMPTSSVVVYVVPLRRSAQSGAARRGGAPAATARLAPI